MYRAFMILRVFTPTRALVRMVKDVMINLWQFTVLMSALCFIFSILIYMMWDKYFENKINDDLDGLGVFVEQYSYSEILVD